MAEALADAASGHRPAEHIVRGRVVATVCVRCRISHWQDEWQVDGDIIRVERTSLVKWPCTSAFVLGVARQEPLVELAAA